MLQHRPSLPGHSALATMLGGFHVPAHLDTKADRPYWWCHNCPLKQTCCFGKKPSQSWRNCKVSFESKEQLIFQVENHLVESGNHDEVTDLDEAGLCTSDEWADREIELCTDTFAQREQVRQDTKENEASAAVSETSSAPGGSTSVAGGSAAVSATSSAPGGSTSVARGSAAVSAILLLLRR